mgnify:FL=1|jgi:hypothetical protein|nr:MAG TPA: ATP synthase B/B' [Caudoviricetes sp.]
MMNYLLLIGFTVLITLEIFNRVSVRPLVKIIEDLRDFDNDLLERLERALLDCAQARSARAESEEELRTLRNDLSKLKAEREQLQGELLEQLEKRTEEGE